MPTSISAKHPPDVSEQEVKETALGRLQKVDLREVWESEPQDFTPWLASEKNIVLLGEALNMELEVEAQEKRIGSFSADILCRDTVTGGWVVIENQLEKTDHTHLGQILTYGAGLHAATVVWIASRFTDEHRAALDWLNEMSDERISFFGLEIECWKIGSSPPAPKFNVVSKPNDWSRSVTGTTRSSELSETQQGHLDYQTEFGDFVRSSQIDLKTPKPDHTHWMNFSVGNSKFGVVALRNSVAGWIGVEFICRGSEAKAHFSLLEDMKEEIETQIGKPLEWRRLPGKQQSRVRLRLMCDPNDRSRWPEYHQWLVEHLTRYLTVFRHSIKNLNVEDFIPEDAEAEQQVDS
jgi:hypothetical protein